jgi:hypothetical protein
MSDLPEGFFDDVKIAIGHYLEVTNFKHRPSGIVVSDLDKPEWTEKTLMSGENSRIIQYRYLLDEEKAHLLHKNKATWIIVDEEGDWSKNVPTRRYNDDDEVLEDTKRKLYFGVRMMALPIRQGTFFIY